MKRVYILLCAGLCALCACKNPSAAGGKEDGATYKTMTVAPSERTLRSSYTAKLQGRQMVEVRPQVSGIITAIKIREGEMVRRGQTLFVNKDDTGGDRSQMAEGDHVTPLETIHANTGYFAERYVDLDKVVEVEYKGPDGKVKKHKLTVLQQIANDDTNFQVLSGDKNAAKGGNMTNGAFIDQCEKASEASKLYKEMETASPERKAELQKEIKKLKLRPSFKKAARQMANEEKLTPEEREKLKKYKLSEKEEK